MLIAFSSLNKFGICVLTFSFARIYLGTKLSFFRSLTLIQCNSNGFNCNDLYLDRFLATDDFQPLSKKIFSYS